MSKKNNLAIRARQHAFDLRREQAEKEKQKKKAAKNQRKQERQAVAGVVKKKNKGVRVRKGVRIKGIKVVDADTKREALQLLKAEAAMRQMDVEEEGAAEVTKTKKKKVVKVAGKKKKKKASSGEGSKAKAGDAMES